MIPFSSAPFISPLWLIHPCLSPVAIAHLQGDNMRETGRQPQATFSWVV
jgi:hypothetical protein